MERDIPSIPVLFEIQLLTVMLSCYTIRVPRNEAATLGVLEHSQGLHTVMHHQYTGNLHSYTH